MGSIQVCDLLVRNAYVLTMDRRRRKYASGAIAIQGRDIVAVGPDAKIAKRYRPRRAIDAGGALVHPGIIDMHTHISYHMTSKLIAEEAVNTDDAGPWVDQQYTKLINTIDSGEMEYANSLLCGLDMLTAGVTMAIDPGTAFETSAVAEALEGLGMRGSLADSWIIDAHGPQLADIKRVTVSRRRALSRLGRELARNKDPDALVRGHVSVYGMGDNSDELILAAKACADEAGVMFNMHQSQSVDDAEFDDSRFGKHPLVHFRDIGLLDDNCVFVHMNVLRPDEIEPVVDSGMTIVWSPTNTWYYGTRAKRPNSLPKLAKRGVNLTIGTDVSKAAAFGDQLYTAYVLARDQGDYLSPEQILAMMTINAAKALRLEDRLGSIEVGKRADIVIRNDATPEAWPRINMERQQLLLARSRSVDTVIVDGRVVLRGGRHTLLDEAVVYRLAQETAELMVARARA
jgi:cytosine/adenosine deaminase-related metal-dependent hydrolase